MILQELPDGRFLVLDKPDEIPEILPEGHITKAQYDAEREALNKKEPQKEPQPTTKKA